MKPKQTQSTSACNTQMKNYIKDPAAVDKLVNQMAAKISSEDYQARNMDDKKKVQPKDITGIISAVCGDNELKNLFENGVSFPSDKVNSSILDQLYPRDSPKPSNKPEEPKADNNQVPDPNKDTPPGRVSSYVYDNIFLDKKKFEEAFPDISSSESKEKKFEAALNRFIKNRNITSTSTSRKEFLNATFLFIQYSRMNQQMHLSELTTAKIAQFINNNLSSESKSGSVTAEALDKKGWFDFAQQVYNKKQILDPTTSETAFSKNPTQLVSTFFNGFSFQTKKDILPNFVDSVMKVSDGNEDLKQFIKQESECDSAETEIDQFVADYKSATFHERKQETMQDLYKNTKIIDIGKKKVKPKFLKCFFQYLAYSTDIAFVKVVPQKHVTNIANSITKIFKGLKDHDIKLDLDTYLEVVITLNVLLAKTINNDHQLGYTDIRSLVNQTVDSNVLYTIYKPNKMINLPLNKINQLVTLVQSSLNIKDEFDWTRYHTLKSLSFYIYYSFFFGKVFEKETIETTLTKLFEDEYFELKTTMKMGFKTVWQSHLTELRVIIAKLYAISKGQEVSDSFKKYNLSVIRQESKEKKFKQIMLYFDNLAMDRQIAESLGKPEDLEDMMDFHKDLGVRINLENITNTVNLDKVYSSSYEGMAKLVKMVNGFTNNKPAESTNIVGMMDSMSKYYSIVKSRQGESFKEKPGLKLNLNVNDLLSELSDVNMEVKNRGELSKWTASFNKLLKYAQPSSETSNKATMTNMTDVMTAIKTNNTSDFTENMLNNSRTVEPFEQTPPSKSMVSNAIATINPVKSRVPSEFSKYLVNMGENPVSAAKEVEIKSLLSQIFNEVDGELPEKLSGYTSKSMSNLQSYASEKDNSEALLKYFDYLTYSDKEDTIKKKKIKMVKVMKCLFNMVKDEARRATSLGLIYSKFCQFIKAVGYLRNTGYGIIPSQVIVFNIVNDVMNAYLKTNKQEMPMYPLLKQYHLKIKEKQFAAVSGFELKDLAFPFIGYVIGAVEDEISDSSIAAAYGKLKPKLVIDPAVKTIEEAIQVSSNNIAASLATIFKTESGKEVLKKAEKNKFVVSLYFLAFNELTTTIRKSPIYFYEVPLLDNYYKLDLGQKWTLFLRNSSSSKINYKNTFATFLQWCRQVYSNPANMLVGTDPSDMMLVLNMLAELIRLDYPITKESGGLSTNYVNEAMGRLSDKKFNPNLIDKYLTTFKNLFQINKQERPKEPSEDPAKAIEVLFSGKTNANLVADSSDSTSLVQETKEQLVKRYDDFKRNQMNFIFSEARKHLSNLNSFMKEDPRYKQSASENDEVSNQLDTVGDLVKEKLLEESYGKENNFNMLAMADLVCTTVNRTDCQNSTVDQEDGNYDMTSYKRGFPLNAASLKVPFQFYRKVMKDAPKNSPQVDKYALFLIQKSSREEDTSKELFEPNQGRLFGNLMSDSIKDLFSSLKVQQKPGFHGVQPVSFLGIKAHLKTRKNKLDTLGSEKIKAEPLKLPSEGQPDPILYEGKIENSSFNYFCKSYPGSAQMSVVSFFHQWISNEVSNNSSGTINNNLDENTRKAAFNMVYKASSEDELETHMNSGIMKNVTSDNKTQFEQTCMWFNYVILRLDSPQTKTQRNAVVCLLFKIIQIFSDQTIKITEESSLALLIRTTYNALEAIKLTMIFQSKFILEKIAKLAETQLVEAEKNYYDDIPESFTALYDKEFEREVASQVIYQYMAYQMQESSKQEVVVQARFFSISVDFLNKFVELKSQSDQQVWDAYSQKKGLAFNSEQMEKLTQMITMPVRIIQAQQGSSVKMPSELMISSLYNLKDMKLVNDFSLGGLRVLFKMFEKWESDSLAVESLFDIKVRIGIMVNSKVFNVPVNLTDYSAVKNLLGQVQGKTGQLSLTTDKDNFLVYPLIFELYYLFFTKDDDAEQFNARWLIKFAEKQGFAVQDDKANKLFKVWEDYGGATVEDLKNGVDKYSFPQRQEVENSPDKVPKYFLRAFECFSEDFNQKMFKEYNSVKEELVKARYNDMFALKYLVKSNAPSVSGDNGESSGV